MRRLLIGVAFCLGCDTSDSPTAELEAACHGAVECIEETECGAYEQGCREACPDYSRPIMKLAEGYNGNDGGPPTNAACDGEPIAGCADALECYDACSGRGDDGCMSYCAKWTSQPGLRLATIAATCDGDQDECDQLRIACER